MSLAVTARKTTSSAVVSGASCLSDGRSMRHRKSKNFINSDDLCVPARMVRRAIGESIDRKFDVNAIATGTFDHYIHI